MKANFLMHRTYIIVATYVAMMFGASATLAQTSSTDQLEKALDTMRYWVGASNAPADRKKAREFANTAIQLLEAHSDFKSLKRIKVWEEIADYRLTVNFPTPTSTIELTPKILNKRALELRLLTIKQDQAAEYARTLDRQILALIDRKSLNCLLPNVPERAITRTPP